MSDNTKISESSIPFPQEIPREKKTPSESPVEEITSKILKKEDSTAFYRLSERNITNQPERLDKTQKIASQVIKPKPLPKIPKMKTISAEQLSSTQKSSEVVPESSYTSSSKIGSLSVLVLPKTPKITENLEESNPAEAMTKSGENSPQAGKPQLNDPGKHITQIWSDKAGYSAKEEIKRIDTVDELIKSAEAHIKYYNNQLNDSQHPPTPSEKHDIQKKIEFHKKVIQKCQSSKESGVTWANSDFFRDILRGNENLDSKKNPKQLKGAIEEYEKLMTDNYYSRPLAVNLRRQSCEVITEGAQVPSKKNSQSWVRAAVMSDMSNGFVNLQSLKELHSTIEQRDFAKTNEKRTEMAKEIIEVWKENKAKGNKNIDATAGFALKQLGFTMEEIEEIASKTGKKGAIVLPSVDPNNFDSVKEVIQDTIEKRNFVISQQFLNLVTEQINSSTPEDFKNGQFNMVHVCLMNQNSKKVDGSGWNHNEENHIRDMAAIFDQFDGKKLIFDESGPYIDQEGNIHLPKIENPQEKETTLRSIFINQSVQGYTKNDGTSKQINDKAMGKLNQLNIDPSNKDRVDTILMQEKAGYSTTADIIDLFIKAGFKVSTGCLSTKDRTGFVSALVSDRVMKGSNFSQATRNKIIKKQLTMGPGIKVIIDNTRTKIMKVRPFFLEGLTKGPFSPKGYFDRVAIFVKQGTQILAERRRVKKFEKYGKPPEISSPKTKKSKEKITPASVGLPDGIDYENPINIDDEK